MRQYKFVVLIVDTEEVITDQLNAFAADGWEVINHAATQGDSYSFLLVKPGGGGNN